MNRFLNKLKGNLNKNDFSSESDDTFMDDINNLSELTNYNTNENSNDDKQEQISTEDLYENNNEQYSTEDNQSLIDYNIDLKQYLHLDL